MKILRIVIIITLVLLMSGLSTPQNSDISYVPLDISNEPLESIDLPVLGATAVSSIDRLEVVECAVGTETSGYFDVGSGSEWVEERTMYFTQMGDARTGAFDDSSVMNFAYNWHNGTHLAWTRVSNFWDAGENAEIWVTLVQFSSASGISVKEYGDYDSAQFVALDSAVTMAETFVIGSGDYASDSQAKWMDFSAVRLANTTHVEVMQADVDGEVFSDCYFQVVQGSLFSVQHGDIATGEAATVNESISTVTLSNTITISTMVGTTTPVDGLYTRDGMFATDLTASNIKFTRYNGYAGIVQGTIYYQVIESEIFSVEQTSGDLQDAEETIDVIISSVDTSVSILLPNGFLGPTLRFNGGIAQNIDDNKRVMTSISFVNSTAIKIWREYAASNYDLNTTVQVLEFLDIPNPTPVNVGYYISNPTEYTGGTQYIFSEYEEDYVFISNVTDGSGYADITTVVLSLNTDSAGAGSTVFSVTYDQDTDTFSETTNPSYITLNTETSSAVGSGSSLDISWVIRTTWDITHTGYYYVKQVVTDSAAGSDTDTNSTQCWTESRVGLTGYDVYDAIGTISRGTLATDISTDGRISYYGWTTEHQPQSDVIDIFVTCADTTPTEWTTTTLDNDGFWSLNVKSPDTVGSSTYTVIVVAEGESSGDTNLIGNSPANIDTYIGDRVVFSHSIDKNWQAVTYNVVITEVTAKYEYDDTSYVGTYVLENGASVGSFTKTVYGNYSFGVISMSESTHGISDWTNNTPYCVFDDVYATTSITKYWAQYSETQVNLIWGEASVWKWRMNATFIASGSLFTLYSNGSTPSATGAIYGSGNLGAMASGFYTPTWYYVTIQVNATIGSYTLIAYEQTFSVDIKHSIHIADSGMDIQDSWITFYFHTNWNNATFTIWDNITGTPVEVGYSSSEGWYQVAKPTVVGTHHYYILVNGTHSGSDSTSQTCDTALTSDSWKWREYKFVVNPVTFSITEISAAQNNVSIVLMGIFHCTDLSIDYTIYEAGVYLTDGTLNIPSSGSYYVVKWTKSSATSVSNWTIVLQSGSTNITIYGYNYIVDSSTYTYNSSGYWEGDTFVVGETPEVAVARAYEQMWDTLGLVLIIAILPFAVGISYKVGIRSKGPKGKRNKQWDNLR